MLLVVFDIELFKDYCTHGMGFCLSFLFYKITMNMEAVCRIERKMGLEVKRLCLDYR